MVAEPRPIESNSFYTGSLSPLSNEFSDHVMERQNYLYLAHSKLRSCSFGPELLVGDLPFMSYQVSVEQAVRNAGRFLQQAGMDAVKLEGGRERLDAIAAILAAGIPGAGLLALICLILAIRRNTPSIFPKLQRAWVR